MSICPCTKPFAIFASVIPFKNSLRSRSHYVHLTREEAKASRHQATVYTVQLGSSRSRFGGQVVEASRLDPQYSPCLLLWVIYSSPSLTRPLSSRPSVHGHPGFPVPSCPAVHPQACAPLPGMYLLVTWQTPTLPSKSSSPVANLLHETDPHSKRLSLKTEITPFPGTVSQVLCPYLHGSMTYQSPRQLPCNLLPSEDHSS